MVNSCRKGKRGELFARDYLRSLGFEDAHRTQQHDGSGESDVSCPETLPNVHIEVKFGYPRKNFSLGSSLWESAIDQCHNDCDGKEWVILWKEKHCSIWKMTFMLFEGLVTVVGDAAIANNLSRLQEGDSHAHFDPQTG